MAIGVRLDEHMFICGQTGSGKTYRAEKMLRARAQLSRVIVIDPKGEFWLPGAKVVNNYSKRQRVQIFRPDLGEFAEPEVDQYDRIFRAVWNDGRPITVYIDELNATLPGPQSALRSLERMYRQGRSKEIAVWASTQQPINIPAVAFTESTHILAFYLAYRGHAEKVENFTYKGVADQIVNLGWHHSLYLCPRRRIRRPLPPEVPTDANALTPPSPDSLPFWQRLRLWLGLSD